MQIRIRRLRWFDPETDAPATPVDWRWAALITATLFLNFEFCERHGLDLVDFGNLPVDAAVLAAGSVLLTALFFLGPAMAAHASNRPLLGLMENSFGSIPALLLRFPALLLHRVPRHLDLRFPCVAGMDPGRSRQRSRLG
jgi:hypothetical protein